MKAGHSKLDGYSATLPARRPFPRLPAVLAPLPPPSPCEKPHGLIPHPLLLSYPEYLLNRLEADPPSKQLFPIPPLEGDTIYLCDEGSRLLGCH